MSDLKIVPVLEGVLLSDLDSASECQCESAHKVVACSVEVRWSRPASICGCRPRVLVCQRTWDYIFDSRWDNFRCARCGSRCDASESRKGWYPV